MTAPVGTGEYGGYKWNNVKGFHDEKDVREQREAALKFLDSQWETKKKFWATVEAVDTYMRVFTDGLIKNPSDIKEIKSMLDEIEVINDWYSDATGNDLVSVFEMFPAFIHGSATTSTGGASTQEVLYPPKEYTELSGSHYYQAIGERLRKSPSGTVMATSADVVAAAMPGNPHNVTIPTFGL
jgi:hypothetical protein